MCSDPGALVKMSYVFGGGFLLGDGESGVYSFHNLLTLV